MTRGKSPRKLHFLIETKWYEVVAHEKILCDPKHVEITTLFYTAKEDEREILQHWLASGYRRQALDDTTAEIIKKLKLKNLISTYGTDLQGIWISSETLSKLSGHSFFYHIFFVFDSESSFSRHIEPIERHVEERADERWNIKPFVMGDDDFTYREARRFTYINFDYVSPETTPP